MTSFAVTLIKKKKKKKGGVTTLLFWAVLLKWAILRLGHEYDVIVKSYVGCLYLFCYGEETHSYIMVPIDVSGDSVYKLNGEGVVTW